MSNTLYLVRHAQSIVNTDKQYLHTNTNINGPLTNEGVAQAKRMAETLTIELVKSMDEKEKKRIIVWNSPYKRTTQTADILKQHLKSEQVEFEEFESIYLSERQFGIIDTSPIEYLKDHRSPELHHYRVHTKENQDFWARPPMGESPFDVSIRIDFFLKTILPTFEKDNENVIHVFVSHGMALRAIRMMYLNKKVSEYTLMPNPHNASVLRIKDGTETEIHAGL